MWSASPSFEIQTNKVVANPEEFVCQVRAEAREMPCMYFHTSQLKAKGAQCSVFHLQIPDEMQLS